MTNNKEIIKRLSWLRDDMRHQYKALKKLGFNQKHLEELYGATKIVTTWINGERKAYDRQNKRAI